MLENERGGVVGGKRYTCIDEGIYACKDQMGGGGFNESFKLIEAKEIFYVDNLINFF